MKTSDYNDFLNICFSLEDEIASITEQIERIKVYAQSADSFAETVRYIYEGNKLIDERNYKVKELNNWVDALTNNEI